MAKIIWSPKAIYRVKAGLIEIVWITHGARLLSEDLD
jgi:hypothetical protein